MATKRKPTRRPTASRAKQSSLLDKYGGAMKLFANYGAAGLFGGYLLVVTLPDAQKSFTNAIEKQAAQNREDRQAAFVHGEKAVEKIATSIDGLRGTFGSIQNVTHGNQSALLKEQQKTNEILLKMKPE